jgi:hypothetical protein
MYTAALARLSTCELLLKRVRETTTLFIARRGWIIHRAEPPLFPLSLRKKEEGGAFNWRNQWNLDEMCNLWSRMKNHLPKGKEMGLFPQREFGRWKLWLLLFLRRRWKCGRKISSCAEQQLDRLWRAAKTRGYH